MTLAQMLEAADPGHLCPGRRVAVKKAGGVILPYEDDPARELTWEEVRCLIVVSGLLGWGLTEDHFYHLQRVTKEGGN
jgi:hypothetical protein